MIVAVPLLVLAFLGINRHYRRFARRLKAGVERRADCARRRRTRCCSGWSRSTSPPRGRSGTPATINHAAADPRAARARQAHGSRDPPALVGLRAGGAEARDPADRGRPHAGAPRGGLAAAARRVRLRDGRHPGAVQAPVASLGGRPHVVPRSSSGCSRSRGWSSPTSRSSPASRGPEGHTPKKLVVRVLLANVHAGAMRAISYAQALGADDVRAVSFAFDGEDGGRFRAEWQRAGLTLPLDLSDAPYRDIGTPLRAYIRELTADPGHGRQRRDARDGRPGLGAAAAQPARPLHQADPPLRAARDPFVGAVPALPLVDVGFAVVPRRRPSQGLERVLGAPALFATAYGNVGSSIYYALGLTAGIALGLTPIVFIISGIIFAATAATYAEGTVRYPEAGGSSSFARHAFNEFVSFGAAWAQMLNYVITVAISVIFVPHYLSIFWAPLRTNPWDIIVGIVAHVAARRDQHHRDQGGGEPQRLPRRHRLRDAAPAGGARLLPDLPSGRPPEQRPPRGGADVERVPARDPRGDDRLHRDRDRVEPRRGGARPGAHDPARDLVGRDRRVRHLLHPAVDRALRDAGHPRGTALRDSAGRAAAAWLQERPGAGARREPRPARRGAPDREGLRGHARGHDPLHRDERGRDRRLAHHVRDVEPPPAARDLPAPAPEAQDAVARPDRLRRDRADDLPARRGRSTSSAACTRSARCSRSRSRTRRSCGCA